MSDGISALILLLALNQVHCSTTERTQAVKIIDDTSLNDISEIIDNYEEDFTKLQSELTTVKNNLDRNRLYVKSALVKFTNNLLNEDIFKQSSEPRDEFQCRNYGRQCGTTTTVECSEHMLNKEKFNSSIYILSKLLFADFDEKLQKFDHQLDNLLTDVLTSKMFIFIKTRLNKTNQQRTDNETEEWKEEIIRTLEATKEKSIIMAQDLVLAFKTLNQNEEEFEEYILNRVSTKKLKHACCKKSFDFEIEIDGLRCKPPPLPTFNETIPLSISQEDLRKFSLFKSSQMKLGS